MSLPENCPLRRGDWDSQGALSDYRGRVFTVRDLTASTVGGVNTLHSNSDVLVCLVKNSSGITLTGGKLVAFKAGTQGQEVDGYTATTAAPHAGIVDPLYTNGVPNGYDFLIIVRGNVTGLTDLAGGANNVITQDSTVLVALTAAASTSTTAGRLAPQDLTGATALLANQVQNRAGMALSSKVTTNTNAAVSLLYRASWL